MHEVRVGMLGARGVGKTSLLTVMWHCFSETIGRVDLQLLADLESEAKLAARLANLESFPEVVKKGGVGLEGDQVPTEYRFELGRKAKSPSLRTVFHDYPGSYLLETAAQNDRQFVQELANNCAAVLIPVDTPAMMELDGRWHKMINRPAQICGILQRAYQDLKTPRLVILAPVRCEKYIQGGKGDEMLQVLRREYRALLEHLNCPALREQVAVVVTPIQTVGAVQFSRVEMEGDTPVFRFKKNDYHARFEPRDSEQILGYLLRFLLRLHLQHRQWPWPLDWIRTLFDSDNHLKEAITTFARQTKSASPFAILQGEALLQSK
jgi:hypothetical protein